TQLSGKTVAAATSSDIQSYALNQATGMDTSNLTFTVYLVDASGTETAWDSSTKSPTYTDSNGNTKQNTVKVVVTYTWVPENYFRGRFGGRTITLSSTCKMRMEF